MAESGVGKGFDAAKNFFKNHWIAAAVVGVGVVVLALAYDHKNSGKLTSTVAGWPIIGRLFA